MKSSEWERWREVARTLSRPISRLDDLERQLRIASGESVVLQRTDRVLCMMQWVEHREHAVRLQRLASRLATEDLDALEKLV
jgi:hypothetical protein